MDNKSSQIEAIPPNNLPTVNLTLASDSILLGILLLWSIWDKIIKPKMTDRIDKIFSPIQEEKRITTILAQIGIITKSSRVILAAFHNGALDSAGYHLQKLSTVNTYTAPGSVPMAYPIKDLPIGRIMYEIEEMLKNDDWVCVVYDEKLPQPCKDHLLRNDINKMCNKLVKVGNLPIGILSLQYSRNNNLVCSSEIIENEHRELMDELYSEISTIMRRRLIHPSPIRKIFGTLFGTLKLKK